LLRSILISFQFDSTSNMRVKVEFFSLLREKVGASEADVDFIGTTVMDLVEALSDVHGEFFREQVLEGDGIRSMVKILVNGRDVRGLRGLFTELREGDTVSIFPPAAGG
jgi:molybdopterin synthase sulfur carrier subunit